MPLHRESQYLQKGLVLRVFTRQCREDADADDYTAFLAICCGKNASIVLLV